MYSSDFYSKHSFLWQVHHVALQDRRNGIFTPHLDQVLNRADTAPDRADTAPDRADTAPDRTDTAPDRTDTAPDRTDPKEMWLMEEGMEMHIPSIMKNGRWRKADVPVHYVCEIKVSPNVVNPIRGADYALIVQKFQESPTLHGAVAVAAIGLMRDGMLRGKEAAAVRWNDLQREEDGSGRLNLPFSKTNSTGRGDVVYVYPGTMKVLDEMCGIKQELGMDSTDDRIFQMSSPQLAQHIRNACEAAGLEGRFGSYSPRIGMAVDLASAGFSSNDLMKAGRFRTRAIADHLTRNHRGMAGTGPLVPPYQAQQKDSASE